MGFLKRLFGEQTQKTGTTPPTTSASYDRPKWMTEGMSVTLYEGNDTLEVVGESYYQDELRRIVEEEGRDVAALLAPEDDNQYDANAVSVWVLGFKVGFLSREDAAEFRAGIVQLMEEEGKPIALNGRIAGGDSARPSFGVWLKFDPADFGRASPDAGLASVGMLTGSSAAGLLWRERMPSDRFAAIKYLRGKLETEKSPLDRHFMYLELESNLYGSRDVFASALDEYAETAQQHDAEMDSIRPAMMGEFGGIPSLPTYKQMAVLEQKKHDYEAALHWANRGLEICGDDGLRQDYIEDLKVRIGKHEAKLGR